MALAQFTPSIWSARFTSILDDTLVWALQTNRNYEGEVRNAGDTVKIPTFTKDFQITNYDEDGTPIGERLAEAEEVEGTSIDMVIDQQKAFHFLVEDIEEVQTKPNLINAAMARAGVNVAEVADDFLRGVFNVGFNADNAEIPGANKNARQGNIAARTIAIPVATAIEADDGAFGQAFLVALSTLKRKMTTANIPLAGRWLVVSPDTIEGIERWALAKDADGVYVPATSEQALRNGFSGRLLGFDLHTTTRVESVQQSAADDSWQCVAGQGSEAVTMARQISKVESYRPERNFADAVKGLYVYGAKCVHPTRLYRVLHKKAA